MTRCSGLSLLGAVGAAAVVTAWATGRATSMEQAVACASEE
jgi:hypothetical protein